MFFTSQNDIFHKNNYTEKVRRNQFILREISRELAKI